MLALVLAAALDLAPHARNGGALAAAVVRDGKVVSIETHGAPPGSVFRMASLSKVVTAYAVTQLARERRLDLDADIGDGVTLRHLLTHGSGIEDAFFGNTVRLPGRVPALEEHFRARPPRFVRKPGAAIVYSNEGIALAGLIVERAAGMPLAAYVRTRIFEPLGMRSSSFAQPPPFRVVPSGSENEALVQAPAGAMVSNAEDMARLMIALLRDAQTLGLFEHGGALFHTGRSAHESVLYLVPRERLGVFLVHTGGIDRTLRRRYVESIAGPPRLTPSRVNVRSGTYRALIVPPTRVERVGELALDASVDADGNRVAMRLPPFARAQRIEFVDGVSRDGWRLTGNDERLVLTGPLRDPVTYQRIRWWTSGRALLALFAACSLIVLSAALRIRGIFALGAILFLLAPIVFFGNYLPRDAESRPFHVADSIRAASAMFALAAIASLVTPFAAWRAKRARVHAAVASAAALILAAGAWHFHLIA